jgi:hypothetical protein
MSVADEFVGVTQRATVRYALVYRSVDHRTLKATCVEARKQKPSAKYAAFTPLGGFDEHISEFSAVAVDLQELRHTADYDPQPRFKMSDARRAINNARSAVRQFPMASQDHRKAFLTLLLCPPR